MRILFTISILSFLALIWAAVAITRRILASHKLKSASHTTQPEFSQYLFKAAENPSSSMPYVLEPHTSSQEPPTSKVVNQSLNASYDKITSTELG